MKPRDPRAIGHAVISGLLMHGVYLGGEKLYRSASGETVQIADLQGIGSLRGQHNAQNALAAVVACLKVGLDLGEIAPEVQDLALRFDLRMTGLEQHHEARLVRAVGRERGGGALLQRLDDCVLQAFDARLQAAGIVRQRCVLAGRSASGLFSVGFSLLDKRMLGCGLTVLTRLERNWKRNVDADGHQVWSTDPLSVGDLVAPVRLAVEARDFDCLAGHVDLSLPCDHQGMCGNEVLLRRCDREPRFRQVIARHAGPALQRGHEAASLLLKIRGLVFGGAQRARDHALDVADGQAVAAERVTMSDAKTVSIVDEPTTLIVSKHGWLRSRQGSCAATADRDPAARAAFVRIDGETSPRVASADLYLAELDVLGRTRRSLDGVLDARVKVLLQAIQRRAFDNLQMSLNHFIKAWQYENLSDVSDGLSDISQWVKQLYEVAEADLTEAMAAGASFQSAVLREANFTGAVAQGADLRCREAASVVFSGADLRGAGLARAGPRRVEAPGARPAAVQTCALSRRPPK